METWQKNLIWLAQQFPEKWKQTALPTAPADFQARLNDAVGQARPLELLKVAKAFNISLERLLEKDLESLSKFPFQNIKWLVLDVDGTLTDGGMYFAESGNEYKKFNTKDGMAIKRLLAKGIKVAFVSSGINETIIANRAKLLGVSLWYCGTENKKAILDQWSAQHGFSFAEAAYIGDDVNDLEIMREVAVSACPADAVEEVKNQVDIILQKKGGQACVREFADEYLGFLF